MFTKAFWKDTAERVIVTFAEVMLPLVLVATSMGKGFDAVAWVTALSIAGLAAFAALLKCIIASMFGNPKSASLVK